MSVPYEKIVEQDLELGLGTVSRTMPGGGTATGDKVNHGTLPSLVAGASRASNQSILASTLTTVQLSTEDLDEADWYDETTFTFTPTVPGVYLALAQVSLASFTGILTAEIYRGAVSVGKVDVVRAATAATAQVSALLSMNGSTDALTVKVTHTNASAVNLTSATFAAMLLGGL